MIAIFLISMVSAVYFYVGALKSGLNAKRWAVGGLILGPLLFPMYNISKHVAWRRSVGYGGVTLNA
jgi:hypothetical protein